jgi:hypothetical protein
MSFSLLTTPHSTSGSSIATGLPALTRPVYCTVKGYRALDLGGSASLSAVRRHIKLARAGDLHDAIEDAWLAMQIYLWLHGCPLQGRLRGSLPRTPSNSRHAEIGPYRVDRSPDRRRVTNLQISESTIFFCLEGLLMLDSSCPGLLCNRYGRMSATTMRSVSRP